MQEDAPGRTSLSEHQHTSTYVSIRQHAGGRAWGKSLSRPHPLQRQRRPASSQRQHTSAYVIICQHTSPGGTSLSRPHPLQRQRLPASSQATNGLIYVRHLHQPPTRQNFFLVYQFFFKQVSVCTLLCVSIPATPDDTAVAEVDDCHSREPLASKFANLVI